MAVVQGSYQTRSATRAMCFILLAEGLLKPVDYSYRKNTAKVHMLKQRLYGRTGTEDCYTLTVPALVKRL